MTGRAHHVQVAPDAVPAYRALRGFRHAGRLGPLVPRPRSVVVSAAQLEHVHREFGARKSRAGRGVGWVCGCEAAVPTVS